MQEIELSQQKKSRRSLLLVIAVFVLPIILAKLALSFKWLDYGVTNEGRLTEQPLTLKTLGVNTENFAQQWLIIYALPDACQNQCEQTLESIHNSYVALGKEMPRVSPVILEQATLSTQQKSRIASSQWHIVNKPNDLTSKLASEQVLIVDPLGNVVLTYATPKATTDLLTFGHKILADMKKLLKYSKIG